MSACPRQRRSRKKVLALLALALTVPTLRLPASALPVGGQVPVSVGCDAKAKPAKLNFTLKNLTGAKVALSDFKGKVIILDFWATWCIPCRTEIPGFVELQTKYGDRGLQIVGLSVDDPLDKLNAYVADMKMNYPVLQGKGHPEILDAYQPIPSIPTSVVIGRDGRICAKHVGIVAMDVLEREVKALF
jgi:cytochrome c biogenesis protein CcmG/thiol:disulfide interchange protein DsbE